MQDLRTRTAVVTGAASGIGRALAERFVAEGMRVVAADVDVAALDDTVAALTAAGGEAIAVRTDVASADEVAALAERAYEAFGAVHVIVNNAGVALSGRVWEHTLQDWEWILGVNLWGVIHGVRTFVPRMIAGGEPGHVVNIASMAGLTSNPLMGAYNVTKHGVVTLTETLHHDLALFVPALKATVVCPGWVATQINRSGRNRPAALAETQQTSEMADAMARLIADGLPASEVAAQIVDAITHDRFWVLTHPHFMGAVKHRGDEILSATNPTIAPLFARPGE
ncbi:MAG: SDR family NAD(P)-dependent oxidoreductase [Kofleriaceae bacterium]|nr:SDR family NAD(P)-dependent oxidoreductase [Kofleriaceae bacterium]MCB9574716.1 SDR family NAD(P)-dependent oxidoreductase [Kofleriaceae bacterium]